MRAHNTRMHADVLLLVAAIASGGLHGGSFA